MVFKYISWMTGFDRLPISAFPISALAILLIVSQAISLNVSQSFGQEGKVSEETDEVGDFGLLEHPVAILPFRTRGKFVLPEGMEGNIAAMGEKISDLMFANLVVNPELQLVDREDLSAVLDEAELNLSGLVNANEAIQIGHMSGAKILVTGSVFQVDDSIYVVSKIISTETTRVVGASAKGEIDGGLDETVTKLSKSVMASIKKNVSRLVVERVDHDARVEQIKKSVGDGKLPKVFISVEEQHVGRNSIDPAAETELTLIFEACGFEVIDSARGNKSQADVIITGEGISEYAARTGDLVSVKARLEVKAVDRVTNAVIAVDRQTKITIDLGEQLAGKKALQLAAEEIAAKIVPIISKSKE